MGGCTSDLQLPRGLPREPPLSQAGHRPPFKTGLEEAPSKLNHPTFPVSSGECSSRRGPSQSCPAPGLPRGVTPRPQPKPRGRIRQGAGSWRGAGRGWGGLYRAGSWGHKAISWGLRLSDLGSTARSSVWGAEPLGAGVRSKADRPGLGWGGSLELGEGAGQYPASDRGALRVVGAPGVPNPGSEGAA